MFCGDTTGWHEKQKIHHLALQTITLSSCIADLLFLCGCPQFSVLSYLSSQSFYTETHLYKSEFVSHFKPPPDVTRSNWQKKNVFLQPRLSKIEDSGYAKRRIWAGILKKGSGLVYLAPLSPTLTIPDNWYQEIQSVIHRLSSKKAV